MSTRGFTSFAVNGETKTAYNHSDSYPDGLGFGVLYWLREADIDSAAVMARALRVVNSDDDPTDEDIARLAPFTNTGVGARRDRPDWYQLLRGTHGDPAAILAAGVVEDASSFPTDSLFAEWGYVVDFDSQSLEVYVGFQREPHEAGRFASLTGRDGYYPVRLIASWSLANLPSDEAFLAAAQESEDVDA